MKSLTAAGIYLYATALAGFGIIQVFIRNFLTSELQVPASIPLRGLWIVLVTTVYLIAAAAIFFRFRRQLALVAVGCMYGLFLCSIHLPALITHLHNGNDWAVLFEGVMLGGGAFMIAGQLPNEFGPRWARFVGAAAGVSQYLFALALFIFATQHIIYFDYIVTLIPAWMPFKLFLACLVIPAYILCGFSFLTGRQVGMAAWWLGIMFLIWVVTLHMPRAFGKWNVEPEWASLFVAMGVCGVAFSIARRELVTRTAGLIVLPRV